MMSGWVVFRKGVFLVDELAIATRVVIVIVTKVIDVCFVPLLNLSLLHSFLHDAGITQKDPYQIRVR